MKKIAYYIKKKSDKQLPYSAMIEILKSQIGNRFIMGDKSPLLEDEDLKQFGRTDKAQLKWYPPEDSYDNENGIVLLELKFGDGEPDAVFGVPNKLRVKYKNYVTDKYRKVKIPIRYHQLEENDYG